MKRYGKIDDNQHEIVKALRDIGASVQSLAMVGSGCPDILVGYRGVNYLMEIKDGEKPPSQQLLTTSEHRFMMNWGGQCVVVNSIKEALNVIYKTKDS